MKAGDTLGPYRILGKLGEGGMGEVYRATDTNLARQVAVKVLPDAVASDPDRLARFDREAKTLAALSHPNIAAVYGLERAGGHTALVMELVEGPTLADRIAEGPMALDEAMSVARQIAEALEAAHERGIIHRDLKPANVKVRSDGTVKVLDFGLAKALGSDKANAAAGGQSMSPTITSPAMTQTGLILGTAGYMSPEQAKGKPIDRRADIWAFGVVLLEMLTGRQAFLRETVTETLGAVMLTEPDWTGVGADVPESVRMVLRRCLQKDPKQRLADMQDVRLALTGAFATTAPGGVAVAAAPTSSWRRALPVAAAAVLVGIAAGGFAVWSQTRPAPPAVAQFEITTPPDAPPGTPLFNDLAISGDGSHIVYASGNTPGSQLYVRRTDQLEATELRGPEPGAGNPFFSPGGEQIGYVDRGIAIKRVPVLGGPVTTITALTQNVGINGGGFIVGASWGPDGTIVFGRQRGGLFRLSAGGEPEQLTKLDDGSFGHLWPDILPNGKGVLFTIWGGSPQLSRIAVVSLETGKVTELLSGGSAPRYVATGHIVYGANGGLQAVGFDQDRLTLTGSPVSVVEGAVIKDNSGAAVFDVADDGSLVYMSGSGGTPGQSTLVWVDRRGREEALPLAPREYFQAFVSPDRSRIAATIGSPGQLKLWTTDLSRPSLTPIPTGDVNPFGHVWTRDSRQIVFGSIGTQIFRALADGTGPIERLATVDGVVFVSVEGWAGDGKTLLFTYNGPDGTRIGSLSTAGDDGTARAWQPLMSERAQGGSMLAVSPDGKWIAYQSTAPGQYSVYLERFPGLGERELISDERGGWGPLWSADGRELFYRRLGDGAMMAVRIQTSPTLRIQPPEVLFESQRYVPLTTPQPGGGAARQWDLSPDGRFLMIKQTTAGSATAAHIVLVQHWLEELARLVPGA